MWQSYNLIMYQPEAAVLLSSGNPTEKWNAQAINQSRSHDDYCIYWLPLAVATKIRYMLVLYFLHV